MMKRRAALRLLGALPLAPSFAVRAQETIKVGVILPMTGPFASIGRQIDSGVRLYMAQAAGTAAGETVEVIFRDDTGTPDITKRLAQELIVNDGVQVLAGFGLTPSAFATAPIATQAKVPLILMSAAAATLTEASPYVTRTSLTLPQAAVVLADWATKNNIKNVITIVTDYAPGIDAETSFSDQFKAGGGWVESLRVPLRNPDFAPFLQKAADAKPEALFVYVPTGVGAQFMKQFRERGLDKTGMKLTGTGEIVDDETLNQIGEVALGTITAMHYSAAHDSPENKAFVAAYHEAYPGVRPGFLAVSGYDGMHLLFEALKKTSGKTDGDTLIGAMKGMSWISPRGPVSIDPETRDIIQNIYIREVKRVGDELWNVEFATIPNVKDPVKAAKR